MESLRPPTDNLYKFVAIFGLALICLGEWAVQMHETQLSQLHTVVLQTEAESRYLHQLSEDLQNRVRPPAKPSTAEVKVFGDQMQHVLEQANRVAFENLKSDAEFKHARTIIQAKIPTLRYLQAFGVIVTLTGFVMWYWRTQSKQDQILSIELKLAKHQLNSNHSAT